jgi:hypothetical protein
MIQDDDAVRIEAQINSRLIDIETRVNKMPFSKL